MNPTNKTRSAKSAISTCRRPCLKPVRFFAKPSIYVAISRAEIGTLIFSENASFLNLLIRLFHGV